MRLDIKDKNHGQNKVKREGQSVVNSSPIRRMVSQIAPVNNTLSNTKNRKAMSRILETTADFVEEEESD